MARPQTRLPDPSMHDRFSRPILYSPPTLRISHRLTNLCNVPTFGFGINLWRSPPELFSFAPSASRTRLLYSGSSKFPF